MYRCISQILNVIVETTIESFEIVRSPFCRSLLVLIVRYFQLFNNICVDNIEIFHSKNLLISLFEVKMYFIIEKLTIGTNWRLYTFKCAKHFLESTYDILYSLLTVTTQINNIQILMLLLLCLLLLLDLLLLLLLRRLNFLNQFIRLIT